VGACVPATRPPAWLPAQDQFLRWLERSRLGAVHARPGGVRSQRHRADSAADTPLFPLPPTRMMIEMSRLADSYGLDVWIWYPAMDSDYSDAKTVAAALEEWGEVFRQLPRVDAVFVPGRSEER